MDGNRLETLCSFRRDDSKTAESKIRDTKIVKMKRVSSTDVNPTIPVHLLTCDGDNSVHLTQARAIMHYAKTWCKGFSTSREEFEKYMEEDSVDGDTRNVMFAAIFEDVIPVRNVDFSGFLEACEDVCFYQYLEMKII